MVLESGRPPLPPFAIYVLRPTWIGGEPTSDPRNIVVWERTGLRDVPIIALKDGFIIFEFDKSREYSGGEVPGYSVDDESSQKNAWSADRKRIELSYQRFTYINAFLAALYSGISTVQKRGCSVQEPADPTNYFIAKQDEDGWKIHMEFGKKINYPKSRSDNLETETLDHSIEVMRRFDSVIGPSSLQILALIYTACHNYTRHQFASAHLIAWAAIEALLNFLWVELHSEIDITTGGHTNMSRARRKQLTGRDYTASVVSQILSINNKISDDILERLDSARRKRNEFSHNLSPIGDDDAVKAIRLCSDIVAQISGVRMTSQLGISYWI